MQNTASLPAGQFEELLRRLPPDLDLDSLARETGAIERKRVLADGAVLLRLSLARGPGGMSLSETAAWATALGFAEMSDPGVKYRLDKAVEFLEAVMNRQLAAKSAGASVRWAGRILRACDGTCIRERGSQSTDWRVHAVYDLGRGGFSHLELSDKHGAEAIDRGAPSPARYVSATAISPAPPACTASVSRVPSRPTSSSGWAGTRSTCAGRTGRTSISSPISAHCLPTRCRTK